MLAPEHVSAIDWSTLKLEPGSYVDEKLAAKYDVDSRYDEPFDYHWGTTRRRDGSVIRP